MNEPQFHMRELADRCAAACLACVSGCLGEPDVPAMQKCIRLDLDCAAACRLVADALARESEFSVEFASLCARLCGLCAEECSRHAPAHCAACAEACRTCAEACAALKP